ncbi:MAG: glycoside hydrolase family 3 C-terminal domain-containing protein, partial [Anaerolineae bacterium]|nr:glycoside hydrolase family 3 C-terminal domain-containing protein [Anaerolineae bacterium]
AQVTPYYTVSPLDGIMNQVGQSVEIGYEPGYFSYKLAPVITAGSVRASASGNGTGLSAEFFDNTTLSGNPVFRKTYENGRILWTEKIAPEIDNHNFSARLTGWYTASETGDYTFSLVSVGLSRLLIDNREVIDNWTHQEDGEEFFGLGSTEVKTVVRLTAGQTIQLQVEYASLSTKNLTAVRIGCLPPLPADLIERAVRLAADSDVAVVYAGLGGEWESEGYDRATLSLPPGQDDLIAQVAAVNPRTIVVLNTGAPVAMPWLDAVAAVVQAWYPGQESGNAIADVLFGAVNPSGRLPQTFPKRIEDNPAYINYPGENGQVFYGEGIFVGYRYYDKKQVEPLFPFGHGLSYTTFEYQNLTVSAPSFDTPEDIRVSVDITNTGARPGQD